MTLAALLLAVAFRTTDPGVRDPRPEPVQPPADIVEILHADFVVMVGMQERPIGSNRGPIIDEANRLSKVPLGSPWCASILHLVRTRHGLVGYGAYSPSWYRKGFEVPRHLVRRGDYALVWFPSKGRYAHVVAFIEHVRLRAGRPFEVVCLEGNTNSQGSREGHGFFRRIRAVETLTFIRLY